MSADYRLREKYRWKANCKLAAELLDEAALILADERRWTRGAHAKDADGIAVDPCAPEACAWCLEGAVLAAVPRLTNRDPLATYASASAIHAMVQEVRRIKRNSNVQSVYDWNDDRFTRHADVLSVARKAATDLRCQAAGIV